MTLIRHIEEGDGVDEDVVEDVDDGNGRSAVEAVGQALLPRDLSEHIPPIVTTNICVTMFLCHCNNKYLDITTFLCHCNNKYL